MHHTTSLPQLRGELMLTDGGLETDLIYHHGFDLPHFASFPLVGSEPARSALRRYYDEYVQIAATLGTGLILEAPTWRANPDWAPLLGLSLDELDNLNRKAIGLMHEIRDAAPESVGSIVVSGCVGPRGDGYVVGDEMDAESAAAYHARQIGTFAEAGVDMVSAFTMTYADEAVGIVQAAEAAGVPVVISFTVETDGRLPSGQSLGGAIRHVDDATGGPAYYMINCAHPEHFADILEAGADWTERILGLRTNASKLSHEELDASESLDDGDPVELGAHHADLRAVLPHLTVLGGCCGTDHRHVEAVGSAWLAAT